MHRNRGLSAWKRAVCVLLIVTLTLTQSIHIPALSGEEARPRWKLVALLVEKDLWENTTRADDTLNTKNGLTTQDRIRRYAQDIQGAEPETVTMIIPIDRQEAPANIARALEQLYWAGSPGLGGTASTRLDNLVGVVLIGEVPLPVITAQQQKVVSLLPYTDFANKKYFYNATTDTFSAPGSDYDGNPEVWHGLINFPGNESTANQNQINQYLDKNHAWHAGVNEEYTTFNQNVFIADLPRETEKLTTENLTL